MKKLFILINIAVYLAMLLSCQSDAAKADKLRLNNEFGKAAELYKKAANEGDAYAMWRLSYAYNNGDGVEYDEEQALNYLKRAADAGCEEAECDLARAYISNWFDICTDKEKKKGKAMMDALVERTDNSHVMASYAALLWEGDEPYEEDKDKVSEILDNIKDKKEPLYLGLMANVNLLGTSKINPDIYKAIDYYKKAFRYGNRYCAYILYLSKIQCNDKLKADTTEALEWLQKGIESNETKCMIAMADICFSDNIAFQKYHNVSRGIELLKTAARHGSSEACLRLGISYYGGLHVNKDDEKAFEYMEKATKMRNAQGACDLGWYYILGTGCEKNVEKGIETWKKAVEYGSAHAANNLFLYYHGGGSNIPAGPRENVLAKEYLLKAANMGEEYACYNLGAQYFWGNDLFEHNTFLAFLYTKKAADAGMIDACSTMVYFYSEGIGCDKNLDKAKEYENKIKSKEDLEKEHQK